MEVLVQSVLPSSFRLPLIDFFSIDNMTISAVHVWILVLTLVFVAVQADAWLSSPWGIQKRIQSIRGMKKGHSSRKKKTTNNRNNNEEGDSLDENGHIAANLESEEAAERKLLSLLPWWEDSWSEAFMNSFPLSPLSSTHTASAPPVISTSPDDMAVSPDRPVAEIEKELSLLYDQYTPNPDAKVLHFCFLLHGHRSFAADLFYLQRVMQHYAEQEKRKRYDSSTASDKDREILQHDMIVHCPVCNEGKTSDGVISGGERMVLEILQVIRQELKGRSTSNDESTGIQDITVSIVGNSLGGIYGRYAIAKLAQHAAEQQETVPGPNSSNTSSSHQDEPNELPDSVLLDGKYRLHFNIFCTTAAPHLGISKHTYVPLPRSAEIGVAHALGNTGKDLFRLNDLLKTMATCDTFLEPLRKFRKRVAYANAYATDFPVPASTAAFLSDQSTVPHYFSDSTTDQPRDDGATGGDSTQETNSTDDYIVATLHTRPGEHCAAPKPSTEATIVDDLVQMSNSLDCLVWTKVFIDVRKEIPIKVSIPWSLSLNSTFLSSPSRLLRRFTDQSHPSSTAETETGPVTATNTGAAISEDESSTDSDLSSSPPAHPAPMQVNAAAKPLSAIQKLQQQGVVESKDLASIISTPEDMSIHFPLGHNMMVALSREGISGRMYKGGRPVMDALAKELVHDIFDWTFQDENDAVEKTLKAQASTSDQTSSNENDASLAMAAGVETR